MKQPRYVSVTTHIIIEKAKQEKVLTKKLYKESKILLLNFPFKSGKSWRPWFFQLYWPKIDSLDWI